MFVEMVLVMSVDIQHRLSHMKTKWKFLPKVRRREEGAKQVEQPTGTERTNVHRDAAAGGAMPWM
jgi:hypothetical protein